MIQSRLSMLRERAAAAEAATPLLPPMPPFLSLPVKELAL